MEKLCAWVLLCCCVGLASASANSTNGTGKQPTPLHCPPFSLGTNEAEIVLLANHTLDVADACRKFSCVRVPGQPLYKIVEETCVSFLRDGLPAHCKPNVKLPFPACCLRPVCNRTLTTTARPVTTTTGRPVTPPRTLAPTTRPPTSPSPTGSPDDAWKAAVISGSDVPPTHKLQNPLADFFSPPVRRPTHFRPRPTTPSPEHFYSRALDSFPFLRRQSEVSDAGARWPDVPLNDTDNWHVADISLWGGEQNTTPKPELEHNGRLHVPGGTVYTWTSHLQRRSQPRPPASRFRGQNRTETAVVSGHHAFSDGEG